MELTKKENHALLSAAEMGYRTAKARLSATEQDALDRALSKLAKALDRPPFAAVRRGTPLRGAKATQAARETRTRDAAKFAAKVLPYIRDIQAEGVTSLGGIARELTKRRVRTARGGSWASQTVRDILVRSEEQ